MSDPAIYPALQFRSPSALELLTDFIRYWNPVINKGADTWPGGGEIDVRRFEPELHRLFRRSSPRR